MPKTLVWSTLADTTITAMRANGATWLEVSKILGLSRSTVIERGRRLRAVAPARFVPPPEIPEDRDRPPLRAGHDLTWKLISSDPYPDWSAVTNTNGRAD
jgi:hypothetical protein